MEKKFFDKFLTFLLVILIIAIIGGAGYLIIKYYEKIKINNDSEDYLTKEFQDYLNQIAEPIPEENNYYNEIDETNAIAEQTNQANKVRGIDTNALRYKGYKVEGKIEMPTVNLQYPILEQMTNMNELEVSVAIQYGPGINKVGNTIIIGHNYRSGLFFGSNKKMNIGDIIYITDTETGNRIAYQIYNKYTTEESDTAYFNRDTQGKREVTLVTCQSDNRYRLVIWAKEM